MISDDGKGKRNVEAEAGKEQMNCGPRSLGASVRLSRFRDQHDDRACSRLVIAAGNPRSFFPFDDVVRWFQRCVDPSLPSICSVVQQRQLEMELLPIGV